MSVLFATCPLVLAQGDSGGNPVPSEAGQEGAGDQPIAKALWQASVGNGSFMVALDKIASVSRHSYLMDGVIVDEVTVDTVGQALARFYFIKPVTDGVAGGSIQKVTDQATAVLGQAAKEAGTNVHEMVVKVYPTTTHAKTVEFRLRTEKDLDALYKSVSTAWEDSRGRRFTVK